MKRNALCPCCSQNRYCDCCQKYHRGLIAESALVLMRSRYTAYALGLLDYIIETTHPFNRQFSEEKAQWKKEIQSFVDQTIFEKLEIIQFVDSDKEAFVTFKAYLRQNGKDASFIEKSRFLKIKGKWLYIDAVFPVP